MIGLIPELADLSGFPGMTPEKVRAGLTAQSARIREAGYDLHDCLVDRGETALTVIAQKLTETRVDCVVIGAGVRVAPSMLLLFEKILNVVHQHAPQAKICFNTNPGDSLEAIRRWLP
jgi:hypothetical protein